VASGVPDLYGFRFQGRERQRAEVWKVLCERFFQRLVPEGGTVLDGGCGSGEFLNHVRAARRIGIDADPRARESLAPGIEFRQGSVLDLDGFPPASVDLFFCSNLLEHLAGKEEVGRFLDTARRVLRPGGALLVLGPNIRYTGGAYWDFWDHHTPLTERSLVEAMYLHGLRVDLCIPRFLPYTTKTRLPQHPALVRLYLAVPLAWRVLGQQFLVRGVRDP